MSALLGASLRSIGLAGVMVLLAGALPSFGQNGGIVPSGQTQYTDANGVPLTGGFVFFYVPGTTTPKLTFQDQFLSIPNANPVVLNSAGRSVIWGSGSYRQVVEDQFGNLIWDQITNAPLNSSSVQPVMISGITACGGDTTGIEPNCKVPVLNPTATGASGVPWFGVDSGNNSAINILQGKALNIYTQGVGPVFSIQGNGTVVFGGTPFAQLLRGFIDGFETGAPGGAQVLTIGPGAATVGTVGAPLVPASLAASGLAVTKTMGAFALGSGNGCLDTGSVLINSSYWLYLIQRTDTGATDFLCSLSVNAPVIPTLGPFGYIRGPLAWFRTDSSAFIIQYQQRGDEFIYGLMVQDVNAAVMTTANRTLYTLSVPIGFQVIANFRFNAADTSGTASAIFTSPDETDQVPSITTGTADVAGPGTTNNPGWMSRRTNVSGQIGGRASTPGTKTLNIETYGFIWTRGRNN